MGFRCAAAHCRSDSGKKLSRYPWMSCVRWVKWPKNPRDSSRWKRLVRRGGRDSAGCVDVFTITRRTRLCSRHFDQESIRADNTATSDPVYFAWNNWGNPFNSSVVMEENDGLGAGFPRTSNQTVTLESSDDIPEVGAEIVYSVPSPKEHCVGKLNKLKTSAPTRVNSSTQTSLTSDDIEGLLKKTAQTWTQTEQTATSGKHFVEMVTDTEKRVNFLHWY